MLCSTSGRKKREEAGKKITHNMFIDKERPVDLVSNLLFRQLLVPKGAGCLQGHH
jgi:hypothetical protein